MNIVDGRLRFRHLEELINKIREKVSGGKMRLLSAGGKLTLLKHLLSSLPIYLLSVLQVHRSVLITINRILLKHIGLSEAQGGLFNTGCLPGRKCPCRLFGVIWISGTRPWHNITQLPRKLRGLIRTDKLNLSYLIIR